MQNKCQGFGHQAHVRRSQKGPRASHLLDDVNIREGEALYNLSVPMIPGDFKSRTQHRQHARTEDKISKSKPVDNYIISLTFTSSNQPVDEE